MGRMSTERTAQLRRALSPTTLRRAWEFPPAFLRIVWLLLLAGGLALAIWAAIDDHFPGDVAVGRWLQDHDPGGQPLIDFFRNVGSSEAAVVTIAVIFAFLSLTRRRRMAFVVLGLVLALVLQTVLKEVVDRPRTSVLFLDQRTSFDSPSFPSGHAMSSITVGATLLYLVWRLPGLPLPRLVVGVWALGLALLTPWVSITGGVHWPSDVLGGLVWASIFLAPFLVGMEWARSADLAPGPDARGPDPPA